MTVKGPKCSKCGRRLRDAYSIAVGMGPECRGGAIKKGAKLPRPNYRVRAGRVELVGLVPPSDALPVHVEEEMKNCEICNKPPKGSLTPLLTTGPKGYRRYQACPACCQKAAEEKAKGQSKK